MPMIDVRDLQMYFELHGSGPPMLNITGTGNDLRRSAPAVHPLNEHFTVLHYDQRGLGRTSTGKPNPSMADFADDAAALIGEIGWDSCHVVGTSFGGMVAQHLVIRHPSLVERLVLNCTSPGGSLPSYPLQEFENLPREEAVNAKLALFDERYNPTAEDPIPGLGVQRVGIARSSEHDELKAKGRRASAYPLGPLGSIFEMIRDGMMVEPEPEAVFGLRQQLETRRHHDVEETLKSVSTETLVCAGRFDLVAPVANSQAIVDQLQNGSLRLFDGGHIFMLQDRTAMPAIAEFLLAGS